MRVSALFFLLIPVSLVALRAQPQSVNSNDQVLKALDDLEWRLKLSDIADVDKVAYASLDRKSTRLNSSHW
jgi:hypothetical protein